MIEFASMTGLLALTALVPFIILYLRRPKPLNRMIPSLMFLTKEKKISKQNAFLKKLVSNLLFFLQLLIILAMAFAVGMPYIKANYSITTENTVIILDVSASMQANNRFDKALIQARKYTAGKVSVILAENTPLLVLEEEEPEVAAELFSSIKPKATTANLGDAMIMAKEILKARPGRVVVISDFCYSDGINVLVAQRILAPNDIDVVLVDVSDKAGNVGIIGLNVDIYKTSVYVKNFNDKEETVTISLEGKNSGKSDPIKILPNSVEKFEFDTSPGTSTISIDSKDSLELDNKAYVSSPEKEKINVLLVTDAKDNKIIPALQAAGNINVEIKYFTPERSLLSSYDIIILNKFQYVPGTFEDLSYYVKSGGNAIISVQDNIAEMRMADLLMVKPRGVVQNNVQGCIDIINELTKNLQNERCFTALTKYVQADLEENVLKIASTSDNNPLIAVKEVGKGKAVYYGIYDDNSDFWQLPSYPIFWVSLTSFLVGTEDISEFNFKTGRIISIDKQKVKTPSTTLNTAGLILDEAGIYEFDNKKVAVNLLDEKESDIDKNEKFAQERKNFNIKSVQKLKEFHLDIFLIIIAVIILTIELLYIKRRGDL